MPHAQVTSPRPGPVRQGLRAAKANLVPGLIVQAVAVSILLAYYFADPAKAFFQQVAALKEQYGFLFSAISTATFGGLIPFLVHRVQRHAHRAPWGHLLFFIGFWAYKGMEIDLFYRLQVMAFGPDPKAWEIVLKVVIDQMVYVPVWAIPSVMFGYLWKDSGFSLRRMWRQLGPHWYRRRVLPLMVSNWVVWIPAVTVIYLLPPALQLPMQNLVLLLFSLLLMFLTREGEADPMVLDEDLLASDAPRR